MKFNTCMFILIRKLKIGYYLSDGRYSPHPGCQRAVKEAVVTLRKMGHTVVEVRKTTHNLALKGLKELQEIFHKKNCRVKTIPKQIKYPFQKIVSFLLIKHCFEYF